MNFKNKIVFITGASRGIGKNIIKNFAKKEAIVIGTATSKKGLHKIKKNTGKYKNTFAFKLDLKNDKEIDNIFKDIKNKIGMPDILINNAGINKDNIILRLKNKEWDDIIKVNLSSIFKISKICLKHMVKKRWGRIINIGSIVGSTGNYGQSNYSASKAGILGFSKSLAKEMGSRNITVNVISPGFIKTDMTKKLKENQKKIIVDNIPLKRLGSVQDISNAAMFLSSNMSEYITGQTIHVNGGLYM